MEKVAVICCFNKKNILEDMLEKSLLRQKDVIIERIYFENAHEAASACFNKAVNMTDAEFLVFVHQDIEFLQDDFLLKIVQTINLEKGALYGLCGSRINAGNLEVVSNVIHGLWNKKIGNVHSELLEQVHGLDEIFLACHRSIFETIKFDEIVMNGWHLYLADFCLQAKIRGFPIYVLPLSAQHKNSLEMPQYMMIYKIYPDAFYAYLKALRKKYLGTIKTICCPCVTIDTSFFKFWPKYYKIRFISKRRDLFRRLSVR